MNVLVIIIISLVILAGGITLIYKFIGGAEELKGQLDSRTQQELERLLVDQGQQVALPLHVATIFRGESHVFGIGVLNTGGVGEDFYLEVQSLKVVDLEEHDISTPQLLAQTQSWVLYNSDALLIEENQHSREAILVDVPRTAPEGQYLYLARVRTASGAQYGNAQSFIVNVR